MTKTIKTLALVSGLLVGSTINAGPVAGTIAYWVVEYLIWSGTILTGGIAAPATVLAGEAVATTIATACTALPLP